MQTDCRGAALVHLLALIDAATQEAAGAEQQAEGGGEVPAAALARALQSALGSSFLKKLQELADNDSSRGGSGGTSRAEGLLAVFSPGLSTVTQLQRFLGASTNVAAASAAPAGQQQVAALERLLAAAVPTAVWQRCAASSLRVCWVVADSQPVVEQDVLPAVQALQTVLQQDGRQAASAALADLAGECSPAQFVARLGLQAAEAAAVQQGGGEQEGEEDCWPAATEAGDAALEGLKVLVASLEAHKGALSAGGVLRRELS